MPVILQTLSAKSSSASKTFLELSIQPLLQSQDEASVFFIRLCKNLTWSHFVELIRIEDTTERQFYEVETLQNKWSVREMKRQIDSQLFTRVGLSKDKEKVLEMAKTGQVESPKVEYALAVSMPLGYDGLHSEMDFAEFYLNFLAVSMPLGYNITGSAPMQSLTIVPYNYRKNKELTPLI